MFLDVIMENGSYKQLVPFELFTFLINKLHDLGSFSPDSAQLCLDFFTSLKLPNDPAFQYTNLMNACMICINALPVSAYDDQLQRIINCVNDSQVSLCQLLEMVCILQKSELSQVKFDFNPVFKHLFELLLEEIKQKHYTKCSGLLIACTLFVSYGFNFDSDVFAELWDILWNHTDQRFILNHLKEIQELVMIAPPSMYDKIIQGMLKDNRLQSVNPKCWMLIFRIWKAINDVYHFFELGNAIDSVQGYVETLE